MADCEPSMDRISAFATCIEVAFPAVADSSGALATTVRPIRLMNEAAAGPALTAGDPDIIPARSMAVAAIAFTPH
ncbi:MAG TPA: hypothetical protein VIX35_10700 [Vicinamibacterales bacterium]